MVIQLCVYDGQPYTYINTRKQFDKNLTSGYKIVIIFLLLLCVDDGNMGTVKGAERPSRKRGRLETISNSYLEN